MIHVFDKLSNTGSRFMDVLIVIEVNFFLLEGADKSFSISVLPRPPLCVLMKSQSHDG